MTSKFIKGLIAVSALAGMAFILFDSVSTKAEMPIHWVTVDVSELHHITSSRGMRDETRLAGLRPEQVVNDIAILRLDDFQMEELSRAMHDNFHKCSGYVAHTTEDEAVRWVKNFETVDSGQEFVTYSINNQSTVNALLAEASELQTRQVILDLSAFPNRRYNQPSGWQSAAWIKNKWTTMAGGRTDVTVQEYTHSNTSNQPSIVMTIQGTSTPSEIVVLGAHQDSINGSSQTASAPGADDDASGVACLTETIRVLMAKNFRPKRTVQFMAYAAEEVGLRGSNAIATDYRNQNKDVVGVLQLDMTNYKGTLGYDIVIFTDYTNAAQNQFIRDLISTYQPSLVVGTSACGYGCSDHASWHNKGYPASLPFEATMGDDNSAIHTSSDTIARSGNNANHALKFSKLALSYVGELAKGCTPSFRSRCAPVVIDVMP